MTGDTAQLDAVITAVHRIPEENFTAYRGGHPGEISSALVDAVYSMRATYDSKTPNRGVLNRVRNFRQKNPEAINDLSALIALGSDSLENLMGSAKTGGRLKATAVIEAAERYRAADVNTAEHFRDFDRVQAKKIYTGVRGLGSETFEYFSMLLGIPGVKVDVMIKRFVATALDAAGLDDVNPASARQLIEDAYERTQWGETLTHFDHAIWLSESRPTDN